MKKDKNIFCLLLNGIFANITSGTKPKLIKNKHLLRIKGFNEHSLIVNKVLYLIINWESISTKKITKPITKKNN